MELLLGRIARSRGDRIEAYYTLDQELFLRTLKFCPTIVSPGARQLTACYTDFARWFIIPNTIPDFGTQLHEISHDFLFMTYPGSEDFPWIKEGSGMYYESGSFDVSGNLVVTTPLAWLRDNFRFWYNQNALIPLFELVTMPRLTFYGYPYPTKTYSQVGMFFFYLMQRHPTVMNEFFTGINNGTITQNSQVLSMITARTGMTWTDLERAYIEFALSFQVSIAALQQDRPRRQYFPRRGVH